MDGATGAVPDADLPREPPLPGSVSVVSAALGLSWLRFLSPRRQQQVRAKQRLGGIRGNRNRREFQTSVPQQSASCFDFVGAPRRLHGRVPVRRRVPRQDPLSLGREWVAGSVLLLLPLLRAEGRRVRPRFGRRESRAGKQGRRQGGLEPGQDPQAAPDGWSSSSQDSLCCSDSSNSAPIRSARWSPRRRSE